MCTSGSPKALTPLTSERPGHCSQSCHSRDTMARVKRSYRSMRYVFGDYTLDPECYELRRGGVRLPLRPKVFELLAYLIAHRDRVVLKDEIVEHLWPNQFIGDTALKSCILTARKAMGDTGRSQR